MIADHCFLSAGDTNGGFPVELSYGFRKDGIASDRTGRDDQLHLSG